VLDRLERALKGLCQAGAFLSAVFMALTVALIVLEIFVRGVFNLSTMVASEYSGYFLVSIVCFGLAYTLYHRAHIRITIFWDRFSDVWKRRVDIGAGILSAAITGFGLYYAILLVYDTYSLGMTADTMVETPLWIPQTAIPIGLLMLLLQLVYLILRSLRS
jgi:TRAP-type C4-dicarboxylate transport system permease small subunit